jgi:polyisoprenoid-binding protein YceI
VRKRLWWVLGAAGIVLVLALGGWWFVLRDSSPPPAGLPEGPAAALEVGASDTGAATSGVAGPDPSSAAPTEPGLDGTWVVQPSPIVWAGYRMREQWANETVKRTVVGRTPGVSGSAQFEGPYLAGGSFDIDLTQLNSGWDKRDAAMRLVLDTAQFPTANLTVSEPVRIPVVLEPGVTATVQVPANLTVHGVTKPVLLTVDARWNGGSLDVAGHTEIGVADFGIDPGTAGGLVSVEGTGTVEFVARLVRG